MTQPTLYFLSCFWGDTFTENFLAATLPCLLAPGNFGSCVGYRQDRYFIFTTAKDASRVRANPLFARLTQLIEVEIREIEHELMQQVEHFGISTEGNRIVNTCYKGIVPLSIVAGAALVNLTPDQLMADGSIIQMRRAISQGKRAIIMCYPHVYARPFIQELRSQHLDLSTGIISMVPRKLLRAALNHTHEFSAGFLLNGPIYYGGAPCGYNWMIEQEGILKCAAGGDPKVVMHRSGDPEWPLESGFELTHHVHAMGIAEHEIYWATDSDVLLGISMDHRAPETPGFPQNPREYEVPFNRIRAAHLMRTLYSPFRRSYLTRPVRFHFADTSERWLEIERAAVNEMERLLRLVEFLENHPAVLENVRYHIEQHDILRKDERELAELGVTLFDLLESLPLRNLALQKLAWEYAVQGRINSACGLIGALVQAGDREARETAHRIYSMLEVTGRKTLANGFLEHLGTFSE